MNLSGPHITVGIESVSAEGVIGMVRHDMRIPHPAKPGQKYGPYPNYVYVDKIKDNVVIKRTTAEEIHEEFDRRLKYKNDRVEGHNELVKERRRQMREDGVDEETINKEGGKFERATKKSTFTNRAYGLLLGFSDDAFELLGPDVPRPRINDILTTALRTVTHEIGIHEDELTHVVIHWDERKPHLHAGIPYLDKYGKRFQKKFSAMFLSRLIRQTNLALAEYGMKPPKPYRNREKRDTHKSTKELKKETQRANEIYLEYAARTEDAKREAELAEAELKASQEKLSKSQRENSEFEKRLADLALAEADLNRRQLDMEKRAKDLEKVQEELKKREATAQIHEKQIEDYKKEIDESVRQLGEDQKKLSDDQQALEEEKAKLGQVKKDAKAYHEIKPLVVLVLEKIQKLPEIIKALADKSKLGKAIAQLAKLVGVNMSDQKGPSME